METEQNLSLFVNTAFDVNKQRKIIENRIKILQKKIIKGIIEMRIIKEIRSMV